MQSTPPFAAGFVVSPWLGAFLLTLCVAVAVVVWLRHSSLDRRVVLLEQRAQQDRERDERMERSVQEIHADMRASKELLHTIVKGAMER